MVRARWKAVAQLGAAREIRIVCSSKHFGNSQPRLKHRQANNHPKPVFVSEQRRRGNQIGVIGQNADTSQSMDHQKLVDCGVTEEHCKLIARMLDPNPQKRPCFRELAELW